VKGMQVPVLQWLKRTSWTCCSGNVVRAAFGDVWTCSRAAEGGHFELLQWAREQGRPWYADDVCCRAAEYVNVKIGQWVKEQECH
jgi:hypothetical protein